MSRLAEIKTQLEAAYPHEITPASGLELADALEAVEALHPREVLAAHEGYGVEAWCPSCREHWPCQTIAAITEALA